MMLQGRLNHVMVCYTQREMLKLLKSEKIIKKFVDVECGRNLFLYF